MADRDPHTAGQYGGPQTAHDDFNPYEQPRFNSYDQHPSSTYPPSNPSYQDRSAEKYTPYRDEPLPEREDESYNVYSNSSRSDVQRNNSRLSHRSVPRSEGGRSGFDAGEFNAGKNDNLWKKGGGARCACRFCGCTLLSFLLLLFSIVGALALYIKPPAVTIGSVQTRSEGGSVVNMQDDGIIVNLGLNITVKNPNYFNVNFQKIEAKLIYPINNTPIGGGNATNVNFPGGGVNKTYEFPLEIQYKTASDPNSAVLIDLAKKCGLLGSKEKLTLNYQVTVGIKVLFITVSPTISNSVSLDCPIDGAALSGMLGGTLGSLLGSS
ncbi:hypothetical protein DL96DRAFT_1605416 [Flagelloscypha sp. PMI_526]|nr:hypothetical protein DL96DRAFT_1605416 [Flagelloscypha sp. PMI_526]